MDLGKRILINGPSGSGKSTLACRLGEITGLPVIHLDRFLWNPGWVQTPREEFDRRVNEAASGENWIIDGHNLRTMDYRLSRADTVIYIDFNRYICIFRAIKRWVTYYGKTRPCMTEGCAEKIDFEFLKWIWDFPKNQRPKILEKLNNYEKNVYYLKSPKDVKNFIKNAKGD